MPRKQNGFGHSKDIAFKGVDKQINKGKRKKAAGYYPSDRTFGSNVHRTVIEKYDLDSDWVKWRKGFEYYNKAAWYELEEYNANTGAYDKQRIDSKLYQGTPYEVDVEFTGYRFATQNADSSNHYVMKRTPTSQPNLGVITSVRNDATTYAVNKSYREIWCQINTGSDHRLLHQMIGERLTDNTTSATLKNVLTSAGRPGIYKGKSTSTDATIVTSTVPLASVLASTFIQNANGDVQALVGKIAYTSDFYVDKVIGQVNTANFEDDDEFFYVNVNDTNNGVDLKILDTTGELPPSLYDISSLTPIFQTSQADVSIKSSYKYQKNEYQRFYGKQYLTADLVETEITRVNYVVLPYLINSVRIDGSNLLIQSVAFESEFKLLADISTGLLVFSDNSFTKTEDDYYNGNYYHPLGTPGDPIWKRIDTDVDPWMDEVFTASTGIQPAVTYACSCPNFSSSQLRMPQANQSDDTRKNNRQERYPLPTALGPSSYDKQGQVGAAGYIQSWETEERRLGFKMCKHTIAAMFIDQIKVVEPNTYPTYETRIQFEDKLEKEIEEVGNRFTDSYKRSGITTLEIVFALAQGLNLDDVEIAMVVLGSKY